MHILRQIPNSVLWLIDDNTTATNNLSKNAEYYSIDRDRLIFSKRIQIDLHLARHSLADLFLDTFPYNAHTTASDALFAGLPIVTLSGVSFASRVCASLLTDVGLEDLITTNNTDYINLAVFLARNPDVLLEFKNKLISNRENIPLFNTELFTRNIEKAYRLVYENLYLNTSSDVYIS
jgi:predicted O-linked N-acetylglucosamine transferase (SPINDLY family)